MSSKYGWIIDKDLLEEIAPILGPSNITPKMTAHLIIPDIGQKFQMFDADGELYYTGRIIGDYTGFEPLDDYGMPNAGCTDIKLFNNKTREWETL